MVEPLPQLKNCANGHHAIANVGLLACGIMGNLNAAFGVAIYLEFGSKNLLPVLDTVSKTLLREALENT